MRVVLLQCGRGIVLQRSSFSSVSCYHKLLVTQTPSSRPSCLTYCFSSSSTRSFSSLAGDSNVSATTVLDTPDPIPSTSSMKRVKKQPTTLSLSTLVSAGTPRTKQSTVSLGTSFELYSLHTLNQHFSMDLRRVGGKDDGGVDLVGWWWVPVRGGNEIGEGEGGGTVGEKKNRRRIRVIAQCKAEKKKMGPGRVRELEGVVFRLASESGGAHSGMGLAGDVEASIGRSETDTGELSEVRGDYGKGATPIVALLISSSPFTKATVLRAHSSPIPMFLLHLPIEDSTILDTTLDTNTSAPPSVAGASAIWNQALSSSGGVLGGELEVRWERSLLDSSTMNSGSEGSTRMSPILWWKGHGPLGSFVP
ncbi:hypothetical protein BKA70DRAFT_1291001 [Coprinopsis sp. MPI-PUGE-AT-0042]|nr:hypothetical protein BKA70DRAFT_1291001 [Coprinopsis sp. MPI-PUGE-AT-0042]